MPSILPLCAVLTTALACTAQDPRFDLRQTHRLRFAGGVATALAFGRADTLLACGGENGDVVVLDVETGAVVHTWDASHTAIDTVAFDPSGELLAAFSEGLAVRDVASGDVVLRIDEGQVTGYANAPRLAWHPRGRLLAARPDMHRVWIVDVRSGEIRARYEDPERRLIGVAFSLDGEVLAIGRESAPVTVWKWERDEHDDYPVANSWATSPCFLGGDLAVGSWNCVTTVGPHATKHGNSIGSLRASKDGRILAIEVAAQGIELVDAKLEPIASIVLRDAERRHPRAYALSDTGELVATSGPDTPITIWRGETAVARWPRPNAMTASSLAFTRADQHVLVGVGGQAFAVPLRGEPKRRSLGDASCVAAGWEPDRALLARDDRVVSVGLTEEPKSAERVVFEDVGVLESISPSPTEPSVAVLERKRQIVLRGPRNARTLEKHEFVHDCAWAPDGARFVLVTEFPRMCGNSLRMTDVRVFDRAGTLEFEVPEPLSVSETAVLGPDLWTLAWARRSGWRHARQPWSQAKPIDVAGTVRWMRFLDHEHVLTHDRQVFGITNLGTGKTESFDVLRVPQRLRPEHYEDANDVWHFEFDGFPELLYRAELAHARNRVAAATGREVLVFEVVRR